MLSGEGNAGERWKTAIRLNSKKNQLCTCSTLFCTFLCRCFPRLQRQTSRNLLVTLLMEEMSYVFSFTFFHRRSFSPCIWLLAARILSPPLPTKKNVSFFYVSLYISVALFLVELRWPAASLSLSLYSKFVDIQLSLILKTTRIQKQFLLSVFVFIDSLAVSTLQDAGGYAISRQNNLELHLGCHTCWLSYFTLVCLWGSRAGRRAGLRSRDYQTFSDG